jgi:ATP-dependent Clp protease ATP-binding subunit ClpC
MFSRFSPAARAVITLAEQECRNASHYYLGTEHLLLAMAIAPPPDIVEYFNRAGVEPWLVKRALRNAVVPADEHPWEGIIVTPRVQRIFTMALSTKAETDLVQPIDLLKAIVSDGGGVAARVLEQLASTPEATRQR